MYANDDMNEFDPFARSYFPHFRLTLAALSLVVSFSRTGKCFIFLPFLLDAFRSTNNAQDLLVVGSSLNDSPFSCGFRCTNFLIEGEGGRKRRWVQTHRGQQSVIVRTRAPDKAIEGDRPAQRGIPKDLTHRALSLSLRWAG